MRFTPASLGFFDDAHGVMVGTAKAGGACPRYMDCSGVDTRLPVPLGTRIGIIATTADGGHRWRVVSYRPSRAYGTVAVRGRAAWVSIGRCGFERCASHGLLYSSDRGSTWRHLTDAAVFGASFGSGRRGWGLLSTGGDRTANRLASTSDGGRTWRRRHSPCPHAAGAPVSLSFLDRRVGWLVCVGEPATDLQAKALFITGDGGATWRAIAEVFPPGSHAIAPSGGLPMVGYGPGIFFASRTRGWMWVERGALSATTDGGATWRKRSNVIEPDVTDLGSAWFVSETMGYALLYKDGRFDLIHTRDGGTTWTTVRTWPPAT